MRLSRNNKGTSLIELVIAMAIAAIVLSMIMLFISGAAKSFRRSSDEVNLQMEAQTTINQISKIAMEARDLDIYSATGDKRFTFECNHNEFYTFIFVPTEMMVYQVQTTDFIQAQSATYSMQQHFLAEYVKSLDITENTENKSATIKLELSLGSEEYTLSKTIRMRNAR